VRHFVVLLASTPQGVILHDPAVGPFRTEKIEDFDREWSGGGHWALLLLPPQGRERLTDPSRVALEQSRGAAPAPPPPDTTSLDTPVIPEVEANGPTIAGCDGMVSEGIRRARSGADQEAAALLATASTLCPTSPTPVRELAGLRFREKQYDAASELAERALVLDPKDTYTWKLLAGSRYMQGDVHDALEAWNRVSEPNTTELVRVDGLRRTRYAVVVDQIDLQPGYLFTWDEYRHVQRRLEEIPAASRTDIELQPLASGGNAQIRVALAERPLLFDGPIDFAVEAGRAVSSSEVELRLSSPLRLGEVWTASYRFQQNRPRALLALDAPALLGGPGLWHLEGMWERQAYTPSGPIHDPLVREERRRGALGYGDWLAPDWRFGISGGLDRFGAVSGEGRMYPTLGASIEVRTASDHLALVASGAGWASGGEHPFRAGDLLARWGSDQFNAGDWLVDAGGSAASSRAPLALWPGAGTGTGRDPLLRAHPLLEEGIIQGLVFGRRLVYANAERRIFPWEVKPVKIGLAVFLDTAKAWDPLVPRDIPWQFDVGAGLRLASLSGLGELRVDFAYGLQDQKTAVSAGLSTR
jgi:tetratricopeptide (TPR) repeat protein